jgi:hypothetical protein
VCFQLNVRKLLEDSRLPAINILCQKVASEGLTRFEDRHRLPFGVSVNLNSFAAKVLAQVCSASGWTHIRTCVRAATHCTRIPCHHDIDIMHVL